MIVTDSRTESYLAEFDRRKKAFAGEPSWLRRLRREGMDRFAEAGFPTTHDEEWRFTDVSPIARSQFEPGATRPMDAPNVFPDAGALRLVFVNGYLVNGQGQDSRITACSLSEALTAEDLEEHLAGPPTQPFAALNAALFHDGAFIRVPRGLVATRPLHLIFVSETSNGPTVSYPRNLYVIGPEAQVTIIETYIGASRYFTNAVTHIVAGENSVVDHYKLQVESAESYHVAAIEARQGRDSTLVTSSLSFGGSLVRNDITAVLSEGAGCTMNGLYLAGGRQHVDHHTTIDHARPHASSYELYKGILAGRASAVFNGRIVVRKDAQKTDAKQTNKNLVLSEDATINTTPELRIFADDVRCTHGATVGQLDSEAMFYLRARGIGEKQARDILTVAFARDVLDRVRVEPLRNQLERRLIARLSEA